MEFARGLLLLLALVLPFEAPLFRVGPLQITSVEVVLYALIAAWGAGLALELARGRASVTDALGAFRSDLALAAALWIGVVFASAAAAPEHRAAATKFALRSLSGVLAFFATRRLASDERTGRLVVLSLGVGALVSAATALAESLAPGTASLWDAFRDGGFTALGLSRASGAFAYPTIGAMYWEAATPLAIAAPLLMRVPDRPDPARAAPAPSPAPWAVVAAVASSALLVGAVLASVTRSALVGAGVACVALMAVVRRCEAAARKDVRRAAAGALVVSSAMVLAASGSGSLLGHRLKWWHDERWLRAEYRAEEAPARVRVGQDFTVGVTVKNTGTLAWDQLGRQAVRLSYHWEPIGRPATLSDFEGQRTSLPFDVAPGREVRVAGVVRAPGVEGAYRLRWDLVKEGVSWFSACGNAMPVQRVEVTATAGEPLAIAPAEAPPPMADVTPPSRPALWRAAVALFRQRPLLGVGADNFRRRYEAVLSPSAGGQPYTDTRLHANSLYFETLADMGIAGALALAWLARCLLRALRDHAAGGRLAGAACAVGAGTFFVHGALDYFFEFTPLFGLFWVLLGLTAARRPATPTPS